MERGNFNSAIEYLIAKYRLAKIENISGDSAGTIITCNKGVFNFFCDFSPKEIQREGTEVPLFTWRKERRYFEMRKNLIDGIIRDPVGMRIKHIAPLDTNLANLLVREVDLAQWILGERVNKVFASSTDNYCNAIFSTDKGIKISAEIGTAQTRTPILLHEVIAKTGVITDTAVDTQIENYPIYLYNSQGTKIYNDVDFELYGLSYDDIAKVRFIVSVLVDPTIVCELQEAYRHAMAVFKTAQKSAASIKNLAV